jgi:truncated hemoglobin YjbI
MSHHEFYTGLRALKRLKANFDAAGLTDAELRMAAYLCKLAGGYCHRHGIRFEDAYQLV